MTLDRDTKSSYVEYRYAIEECDIAESKRGALQEYRRIRQYCLEHVRGPSTYPVYRQLSKLAWHTAVFQTLNEARRLEPDAAVSGPAWKLLSEGYASLMALGIRRLLDKKKTRISLAWVIDKLERNRHLLTREFYICHDGLPYDYEASRDRYYAGMSPQQRTETCFHPVAGPDGWGISESMHEEFDKLCGNPHCRNRDDQVSEAVIKSMKLLLSHESITLVDKMANKVVAHATIIKPGDEEVVVPTYEDVSTALETLVGLANFVCTGLFFDMHFGTVVPIYSGDPVESLDQPWISPNNLSNLSDFWEELCKSMNGWSSSERMNALLFPAVQQPASAGGFQSLLPPLE